MILGRCEMLESGAMGDLEASQQRSVEIIHRNAQRVVEMLDDVAPLLDELSDE